MLERFTLNKSVLLRRIILLLLSAVLLSGLLSAGIYIFVSTLFQTNQSARNSHLYNVAHTAAHIRVGYDVLVIRLNRMQHSVLSGNTIGVDRCK